MSSSPLSLILTRLDALAGACGQHPARLLAVSKTQPAAAVAALAAQGQRAFGENYVQEAVAKIGELAALGLEWHLIGHLQSNKAELAATHFDWVQSVDRPKLVDALARYRPANLPPLNVLIQVNIDDEDSKHGCAPEQVLALASRIAAQPRLQLRGLMAIPAAHADPQHSLPAFQAMAALLQRLQADFPQADTLSMGMSADYPQAVAAGANMVRVGSALFGARPARSTDAPH
ncbi:pyridoxal phosphate biosynthesis protein [Stenotrophomonas ginsengisoli]|uniref:Pyridoxal phosphate homeostasis protein n=1 Tax=Stenotrophomonas ginsengisoli TaxID=336566 RepID=A0A0R0DN90_9GAMM|nr:pyridoxal phosphate biosynthesis protein [Stenotrophomonas ginsengisoli]